MEQKQIESLINQMTLEEKLAQMTQLAPMFFGVSQGTDLTGPLEEFRLTQEDIKKCRKHSQLLRSRKYYKATKRIYGKQPLAYPLIIYGRRNLWI